MNIYLAAFGSSSADNLGYRWLWHAPNLSEHLLRQCYAKLNTQRFSYADELKKLKPDILDGGLIVVNEDWCAAYRFLHGGRELNREKFHLAAGFFLRSDFAAINLGDLLSTPFFSHPLDCVPDAYFISVHHHSSHSNNSIIMENLEFSGPDAVFKALALCLSLPAKQAFHIRLMGPINLPDSTVEILNQELATATGKPKSTINQEPVAGRAMSKRFLFATGCLLVLIATALMVWAYYFRKNHGHQHSANASMQTSPSIMTSSNTSNKIIGNHQFKETLPTTNLMAQPKI